MADDIDYQRVLRRSITRLLDDLYPRPILDLFIQYDFLPSTTIRDIQELPNTTEKNRAIIERVRGKGLKGYQKFKQFLRMCSQEHIADFLEKKEMDIQNGEKNKKTKSKEKKETPSRRGGASGTSRDGGGDSGQGNVDNAFQRVRDAGYNTTGAQTINVGAPNSLNIQGTKGPVNFMGPIYNYHYSNPQIGFQGSAPHPQGHPAMPNSQGQSPYSQAIPNYQGQPVYQQAMPNNQGQPGYQQAMPHNIGQPVYQQAMSHNQGQPIYQQAMPHNQGQPVNQQAMPHNQGQHIYQQPMPHNQGQPVYQQNMPHNQPPYYTQSHPPHNQMHNQPPYTGQGAQVRQSLFRTNQTGTYTQPMSSFQQPPGEPINGGGSASPQQYSQTARSDGHDTTTDGQIIYDRQSQVPPVSFSHSVPGIPGTEISLKDAGQTRPQLTPSTHVSMAPVQDQSRNPITGVDPSGSPATGANKYRSPTTGTNQSESPTAGANQSRSPNEGANQSGSPSTGANQFRNPAAEANQSRSPTTEADQVLPSTSKSVQHNISGAASKDMTVKPKVTAGKALTRNEGNGRNFPTADSQTEIKTAEFGPDSVDAIAFKEEEIPLGHGAGNVTIDPGKPGSTTERFLDAPNIHPERSISTCSSDDGLPPISMSETVNRKRDVDDGRVILLEWKIVERILAKSEELDSGASGKVFVSNDVDPKWGFKVAIKEIQDTCINKTAIRNEMIAARIRHHAIVPLLAKCTNNRKHYFIFPYMEGGNLLTAIKDDEEKKKPLAAKTRVRVLYQIASAIQFIHSEVPNLRKKMVHGDIQSKNIVLYNDDSLLTENQQDQRSARLLDFGVARQLDKEDKAQIRSGDPIGAYTTRVENQTLTQGTDIKNLGIVILELLTNCTDPEELKTLTEEEIDTLEQDYPKHNVWNGNLKDAYKDLKGLAKECRQGYISAKQVSDQLYKILKDNLWNTHQGPSTPNDAKCSMCMLNFAVPSEQNVNLSKRCLSGLDHPQPLVCVACMRNSYINPIQCKVCRETISTKIGITWAAILIQGYDDNRQDEAVFQKDVDLIKELLTSKYPLVTGLSPDNVYKTRMDTLKETIDNFKKNQAIENVFIYYSGHCNKDKDFEIRSIVKDGKKEARYVPFKDFDENLTLIASQVKDIALVMDCCYSGSLVFKSQRISRQFNSASSDEKAKYNEEYSLFTYLFIQSMRGKSSWKPCLLLSIPDFDQAGGNQECNTCKDYSPEVIERGFISVASLFDNIFKHMERYFECQPHITNCKPTLCNRAGNSSDLIIGYYLDSKIDITFNSKKDRRDAFTCQQLPSTLTDLKNNLFKEILTKQYSGLLSFTDVYNPWFDFSDIIAIKAWTYPHGATIKDEENKDMVELKEIPQISEALNQKFDLYYEVRDKQHICDGPVGVFIEDFKTTEMVDEFFTKENVNEICTVSKKIGTTFVSIEWNALTEVRNIIQATQGDSQPTSAALSFLKEMLTAIRKRGRLKKENIKEVKITIPSNESGLWNSFCDSSEDFLLFELIFKETAQSSPENPDVYNSDTNQGMDSNTGATNDTDMTDGKNPETVSGGGSEGTTINVENPGSSNVKTTEVAAQSSPGKLNEGNTDTNQGMDSKLEAASNTDESETSVGEMSEMDQRSPDSAKITKATSQNWPVENPNLVSTNANQIMDTNSRSVGNEDMPDGAIHVTSYVEGSQGTIGNEGNSGSSKKRDKLVLETEV